MAEADSKRNGAASLHDETERGQGALADDGALTGAVNDEAGNADRTAQPNRLAPDDGTDETKGKAADVDLPGVTASGAE